MSLKITTVFFQYQLRPVHTNYSINDHSQQNESRKNVIQLVIACKYPAEAFEPPEIALYLIALLIALFIIFPRFFTIRFWRNDRDKPFFDNLCPCAVAFVSSVHQHIGLFRQAHCLFEQQFPLRCIMGIAGGKRKNYSRTVRCGDHMNFGGESAARPSDTLSASFFKAPVPSGCTLTVVLSR